MTRRISPFLSSYVRASKICQAQASLRGHSSVLFKEVKVRAHGHNRKWPSSWHFYITSLKTDTSEAGSLPAQPMPPRAPRTVFLPMVSTMRSSCPLYTVTLTPASSNSSTMPMTGFMKSPSMFWKTLADWPARGEAERGNSLQPARTRGTFQSGASWAPAPTRHHCVPHNRG